MRHLIIAICVKIAQLSAANISCTTVYSQLFLYWCSSGFALWHHPKMNWWKFKVHLKVLSMVRSVGYCNCEYAHSICGENIFTCVRYPVYDIVKLYFIRRTYKHITCKLHTTCVLQTYSLRFASVTYPVLQYSLEVLDQLIIVYLYCICSTRVYCAYNVNLWSVSVELVICVMFILCL